VQCYIIIYIIKTGKFHHASSPAFFIPAKHPARLSVFGLGFYLAVCCSCSLAVRQFLFEVKYLVKQDALLLGKKTPRNDICSVENYY
jgi:hypothetical protein